MSQIAVIFLAHSDQVGLLFHLTRFTPHLLRQCGPDLVFYVASTPGEQQSGLWRYLLEMIPSERIIVAPSVAQVPVEVEKILQNTDKVIVHCHGHGQVVQMTQLKKRYGSRLEIVVTIHAFRNGTWLQFPVSFLASRHYAKYVSRVIFMSPFAMRKFAGFKRLRDMGKVVMIPQGVEEHRAGDLEPPPEPLGEPDIRPCLLDPNLACLVYLARFERSKNHRWLIKSVAPVLRARPEARLLLLGDGSLRENVASLVDKLGLSGQVLLPGRIDRTWIPWVLTRARAGLSISSSETFGYNTIEPMTLGCPVIATRVGAAEWAVIDFITGLAVARGDSAGLAQWTDLLLSDRRFAAKLGRRSKGLARIMFSWSKLAMAHAQLYRSLCTHQDFPAPWEQEEALSEESVG